MEKALQWAHKHTWLPFTHRVLRWNLKKKMHLWMAAALCILGTRRQVEIVAFSPVSYCFGTATSVPSGHTQGAFLEEVAFGFGRMDGISISREAWEVQFVSHSGPFLNDGNGDPRLILKKAHLSSGGECTCHIIFSTWHPAAQDSASLVPPFISSILKIGFYFYFNIDGAQEG